MAQQSEEISAEFPFQFHKTSVLESSIAYIDTGVPSGGSDQQTAVFLHGNPTSSYLWRNVIPHVSTKIRCIAPDLIGMGKSDKVQGLAYRIEDHARYISAFLDKLLPQGKLVFVLHDWGSALGLNWARLHPERVAGLALMEIVRPIPAWETFPPPMRGMFQGFRDPAQGRQLVIDQNVFLESMLQNFAVTRKLTDEEKERYREPFLEPASREPIFRFLNEIPIAGQPADVVEMTTKYCTWLNETDLPKIFFVGTPGAMVRYAETKYLEGSMKSIQVVNIGPGAHYLQEDNPHAIGRSISSWLESLN